MRTLAAMGGGWLPVALRGAQSQAFMHVADWFATFSFAAGVPLPAVPASRAGLPALGSPTTAAVPLDSTNMWPAWLALLAEQHHGDGDSDGAPSTEISTIEKGVGQAAAKGRTTSQSLVSLGGARTMLLSSDALIQVRSKTVDGDGGAVAFKLLTGQVCESKTPAAPNDSRSGRATPRPPCAPGEPRFVSGAFRCECLVCGELGCLFDVLADPAEVHNRAASLPAMRNALHAQLVAGRAAARRDEWLSGIADIEGCTSCGKCKSVYLDYAARNGHVIQPLVQD